MALISFMVLHVFFIQVPRQDVFQGAHQDRVIGIILFIFYLWPK